MEPVGGKPETLEPGEVLKDDSHKRSDRLSGGKRPELIVEWNCPSTAVDSDQLVTTPAITSPVADPTLDRALKRGPNVGPN